MSERTLLCTDCQLHADHDAVQHIELSASDRIWELILDTILEIAEMISADASELLSVVIDANPKFHKLYQRYKLVA